MIYRIYWYLRQRVTEVTDYEEAMGYYKAMFMVKERIFTEHFFELRDRQLWSAPVPMKKRR